MTTDSTPAALGYRWPAEWEPHAATWIAWPHNRATWPGTFARIPPLFAELVRTVSQFEPVNILAGGPDVMAQARSYLDGVPNVRLWDIETNDAWCRDHGPLFLGGPAELPAALVDWQYNAWGGKYPPYDKDNDVPRRIAVATKRRRFAASCVLEGGAIDGNGQGTVLATSSCLLNANRNPKRTRADVERLLHEYLHTQKVLWLPRGELAGDDTDGHIDQLARFVSANTVVAAMTTDTQDENCEPLRENYDFLCSATDQDGQRLRVVPLPLPAPKWFDGQRLPASYCNFYLANGLLLVPQFEDCQDQRAQQVLGGLLPQCEVRGLPALDLVWGLGAFHCVTLQEPRGPSREPAEVESPASRV